MLSEKIPVYFLNFDTRTLKSVMDGLINKYSSIGVRSVGIQVVDNNDLPALLGRKVDASALKINSDFVLLLATNTVQSKIGAEFTKQKKQFWQLKKI